MKQIEVQINEKEKMVVEIYNKKEMQDNPEIAVYVDTGEVMQDLVVVRPNDEGNYEVLLWEDCNDEEYTKKIEIKKVESEVN